MKVLGLSGNMTKGSITETAVKQATEAANQVSADVEVEVASLHEYKLDYYDERDPSLYQEDTRRLMAQIEEADALIIGSPIYRGSIGGGLKNVFDLIPARALQDKVVGFVATGETAHHHLIIEHQLKPMAGYFRAHIVPGSVYATEEHFLNQEILEKNVLLCLVELGESLVKLHEKIHGFGTYAS